MIDYSKLKLCHELAEKRREHTLITILFFHGTYEFRIHAGIGHEEEVFNTLDDLIVYLQELSKPEPKYKTGDILWFLYEGDICSALVKQSRVINDQVSYIFDEFIPIDEENLFPTRQALIENQIQYWRTQLEDDLEQHVSPYCEPMIAKEPMSFCRNSDVQSNQPQYEKWTMQPTECQHYWQKWGHDNSRCIKCGESYS